MQRRDEFILPSMKNITFYLWVGLTWLVLAIGNTALNTPEIFVRQAVNETWRVIYLVSVMYLFFEYSLPSIRRKGRMLSSSIGIGVLLISFQLVLLSFGLYAWKTLGLALDIYTSYRHVTIYPATAYNIMIEDVLYQAQGGISAILFFGIAKLMYDNVKLKQAAQQLRLEKQEAELSFLKSQTNPHFLFNTLNNIYSLSRDKSDLAPESILRLSKILRYMLYETSGKFARIDQEVETLSDYIALEKLRYDYAVRIAFKHEIADVGQPLPPLLLITLVENAFKHGVAEASQHPFVDIDLAVDQQQLIFTVSNSVEASLGDKQQPDGQTEIKESIGLANLRRQLELLYSDFTLSFQHKGNKFIASLRINLDSYVEH
jgi:two-component system LytT family sensor kinase